MMLCAREEEPEPRYWLMSVWLDPAERGKGGAELLLEAVEDWVRSRGGDALWLEVHEHNPRAIRFYERLGFTETGRRRPYPLDERTHEIEMVKRLT